MKVEFSSGGEGSETVAERFSGKHAHSLDAKGRVIIPAAFRERLGEKFTIALNPTIDALALYPFEKWSDVSERLGRIRETDDMGMEYVRYIMSNAVEEEDMDAQGRVLLPPPLREEVGLERNVMFVGVRDFIEIWDQEAFAKRRDATRAQFAALRRHVDETY